MRNLYKSKLFWLGIVISGVFFYLAARQASVADLSASLSNANYYWLLPVIVILFLNYAIMATRWRYVIKAGADVPFGATFSMLMVGLFVNNVLPMRLGELLRAHMLGKKQGLSRSFSLATIAADRLFDVITLLLMFSIASLAVPLPIWAKTIGILASALLVIGAASYYHSRDTLRGLWKQNFANGTWNVKTLKEAPGTLSLRHTVPFFFVTGLAGSGLLAIFFKAGLYLLAAIVFSYIVLALLFSAMLALRHGRRHFFVLPVVFGCLHLSYGLGYYAGFKRFGLPLRGFVWKK